MGMVEPCVQYVPGGHNPEHSAVVSFEVLPYVPAGHEEQFCNTTIDVLVKKWGRMRNSMLEPNETPVQPPSRTDDTSTL